MKTKSSRFLVCLFIITLILLSKLIHAQSVMETGGQRIPDEWIDKTTNHKTDSGSIYLQPMVINSNQ